MFKGIGASEGYGIGNVLVINEQDVTFEPTAPENPQTELKRYRDAVSKFKDKTVLQAERVKQAVGEKEAEIILGHIMMLEDPYMNGEIEKLISGGKCAESALSEVCDMFAMMFSSSGDELTMQRAADINDIKTAVLSILLGREQVDISSIPCNTILVIRELTPSMTAEIPKENIAGIITETGGMTSHAAILARAMEIPAVLSVEDASVKLKTGEMVIVNGVEGMIIPSPTEAQLKSYTEKQSIFAGYQKELKAFIGKKTETADGISAELVCNIGNPEDANKVLEYDGEGVGLFRTEFLFMDRTSAPNEEEQFEAYKKTALIMKGKPVIIRTLDVGGDKAIGYLGIRAEENPFLGFRAVRYCLKNPEFYKTQLRAIIRASAFGDIRIMIPFVTCMDELRNVKSLCCEITEELDAKNIDYNRALKIGVMIETPAACAISDILAKEADFFSIGTNDLTQYTMSADRGNSEVSYLYSAYNPAVIRCIKHIIESAKRESIPVGICGEAAADKYLIPLFISFGLDEYSVNANSVLSTRRAISQWTKDEADNIAEKVMCFSTENEIRDFLKSNVN